MKITYYLHASQRLIFNDTNRFVVLSAGRRYGKTVLALTKIIRKSLERKQSRVWYVAPTYRQAEMIAWKMIQEMIPSELVTRKNEVNLELSLINGTELALKGAENEDSLRGTGLDFVVMDEYGMMKPNVWPEVIRPMLTDTRGGALFIGTPAGKNHFWELWLKGQRQEDGYSSYSMKTIDNPLIQASEVEEARKSMSARYFRQEYEASFEDYAGLVWPEFKQNLHVIEPIEIPGWYETIAAIDPAITGTTAVLFAAIDDGGNIFITSEYYEQNKRVSEVAEAILGKASTWYCDPAASHKSITRNGGLYSLFDEYHDNGIIPNMAQNDVNAGINRVAEYFKQNKVKIFSTCKNLIFELERYHWSEERETTLGLSQPKPYKSLDHACDCLRYLIMSRPDPSFHLVKAEIGTAEYWDHMEKRQRENRGEYDEEEEGERLAL